jgi:DNA-directed RNA polymerase specialized sigma24 family protein
MHRSEQLRFRQLPPEAQRAALWRLAWSGLAPEQIAERTGWSVEQVRRAMHEELAPAQPSWATARTASELRA